MAKLFLIFFILIYSSTVSFACTIEEIVELAADGAGKAAIREACDSDVDDAPRCSFRKVLTYALADKDEYYIEERCGLCETATCNTGFGSCPLDPSTAIADNICTCFNPSTGFQAQGTAACN